MTRLYLWDFPVDGLSLEDTADDLLSGLRAGERSRVVTLNPEMLMAAEECPALKEAVLTADRIVPDGVGVVWALRRRGGRVTRVTGVDLAERLMEILARSGGSVFLLGGETGVAAEAGKRISSRFPGLRVAGCREGFFTPEQAPGIVAEIKASTPQLLLVGLGTPRQDVWLARNWQSLGVPIGVGIGGGVDLWAGRLRRAPKICRDMGVEWLYRAMVEPKRWQRLSKLSPFVWRVLREGRAGGKE